MSEEKLIELLRQADRHAGSCRSVGDGNIAETVRMRLRSRRIKKIACSSAAAAVLMAGICVWAVAGILDVRTDRQIAALEAKVVDLSAQTKVSQKLVADLMARERQSRRLIQLERELAAISDPLEEIARQNDRTAFIMVYQADRLYRELNLTGSAVETYNRVIELFPENKWAQVARERLSNMSKNRKDNET
jgi:hypothetical protein